MKKSNPYNLNNESIGVPYDPLRIEQKWQNKWNNQKLYETPQIKDGQRSFYALSMFPYPSGNLHMGHVRNYVITDVIARTERMKGRAVLHPMGWDAFGLPAENAARERGIDPEEWTNINIEQMRNQLKQLGLSIDWDREIRTNDSNYYKWTQHLFLELFNAGLAYQQKAKVNWDPIDKTVLANEQVNSEGKSWRSGALVEKKELKQWFLKITDYAEDLLVDLEKLKSWPERVKTMQSNWIGKSIGSEIDFIVKNNKDKIITIFTTRPDTIFGATHIVIAPENKIVEEIMDIKKENKIKAFRKKISKLDIKERTSESKPKEAIFIGAYAINPINGTSLEIWIADYVLPDYGTGAIMAVPGHDDRDFKFALDNGLEIKTVVKPTKQSEITNNNKAYLEKGILINSGQFNGLYSDTASEQITKKGVGEGWCRNKIQYRLRDWLISRQRFWGCPIPIIHCPKCGQVAVPNDELPVELPKHRNSNKLNNSLVNDADWNSINCPICNEVSRRETDTMDTFMCSSWYYLRYTDPCNNNKPFDKDEISKWLPVDHYVGGVEHAILHLLYSRFLTKALFKKNLISIDEPFKKLLTQGMVQSVTYRNPKTGKYIPKDKISNLNNPVDIDTGERLEVIYEKMSKSKYNGVEPSWVINKYGADTARMFVLFKAPPEKDLEWDDADVEGQYRFIQRLWKLVERYSQHIDTTISLINLIPNEDKKTYTDQDNNLRRLVHKALKAITEDLDGEPQFNTAISELMKLSNSINQFFSDVNISVLKESFSIMIRLLSPFAPHIAEEFWYKIGGNNSVHLQPWPTIDEAALLSHNYELVIQVMGKVRAKVSAQVNSTNEEIEELALSNDNIIKWTKGLKPKKVIIVPGKLINIVI